MNEFSLNWRNFQEELNEINWKEVNDSIKIFSFYYSYSRFRARIVSLIWSVDLNEGPLLLLKQIDIHSNIAQECLSRS